MTTKEIKQRYWDKIYKNAPEIPCACGCGQLVKSKDKYGRSKKFINGHNGRKYSSPSQHKHEWNHKNRENRYLAKKIRGHKRKAELINISGRQCKYCNIKYNGKNACLFQFHHKNPATKLFSLGLNTINDLSMEVILEELKKCELVCANCHSQIHSEEY